MTTPAQQLLFAIIANDTPTASSLIASGIVNASPSPLSCAAQHGNLAIMTLLLNAGADIDHIDKRKKSACFFAVECRQLAALKLLIARKANLNLVDFHGLTALSCAVFIPDELFSITLLNAGASIDKLSRDQLVTLAARSVAVLQCLLARNANVSAWRETFFGTACHVVATNGAEDAAALLDALVNSAGVDINAVDFYGNTACHRAVTYNRFDALKKLIELGADIDLRNLDGKTALFKAAAEHAGVELLVVAGADVNLFDDEGKSACHEAVRVHAVSSLCLLLAAGADFDLPDNGGNTPRQLAAQYHCTVPTSADIEIARRRIAKSRLNDVKRRALQVCVGLQPLNLDALQLCEIMMHSCGTRAHLIPFHQWWKIATMVKHFRKNKSH
jgi:ankyrin repeat protein